MFWFEIRCVSFKFMKKKKLLPFNIWCNVDNRRESRIVIMWPIITKIKDTIYDSANLISIKTYTTFPCTWEKRKIQRRMYKCTRKSLRMQFTVFKVRFQIRQNAIVTWLIKCDDAYHYVTNYTQTTPFFP